MNLTGVWQAAYTAGVVLPKPVATAQYWHRSLNPAKLIGVGFSRLQVHHFASGHALVLWALVRQCMSQLLALDRCTQSTSVLDTSTMPRRTCGMLSCREFADKSWALANIAQLGVHLEGLC